MMPSMDGFEVCRRIKENPQTEHIPVVMVTALDQLSDRMAGLEAGADDFLVRLSQVRFRQFKNLAIVSRNVGTEIGLAI